MSGFYRLKRRFLLRGWDRLPYALVDKENRNRVMFLGKNEFDALSLCNGRIDTSIGLIPQEIREVVPMLSQNGVVEECEAGDGISQEQEYRKYDARFIRVAHWSVTGRCNYRCRHCYMSAPDAKYGELSHETVMKMIDELADCGIFRVSLTGGECLVRQDFMEVVDALLEKGICITTIYTNGALVTEHLLKDLDRRGIHPEFNMSFDGIGCHDWLRGVNGAEEKVDRAFELCREYGFPAGAEMCIHGRNKHTLRDTVKHLSEKGCRSLKTNPIGDVGEWKKNGYGQTISVDELYGLYFNYIPQYYEDGMPLSIQLGGFFSADPNEPERFDLPSYHRCEDMSKMCLCGHARQVMYISPEGRALPCMSLSGMEVQEKFPLITETGIKSCITDSFYMNFIDTRASEYMTGHPECQECKYAKYCLGGCRASALETSGDPLDLMARDVACCKVYKEGWMKKIIRLMHEIRAEAKSPILKDEFWQKESGVGY